MVSTNGFLATIFIKVGGELGKGLEMSIESALVSFMWMETIERGRNYPRRRKLCKGPKLAARCFDIGEWLTYLALGCKRKPVPVRAPQKRPLQGQYCRFIIP